MAAEPAFPLGRLQVGPDVVERAVVKAGAVGLLQRQDGHAVVLSEGLDLPAEAVADLLEQRRRGDRIGEVVPQEPHHLAAHLQVGHVGVEVQPVHALDFQSNMAIEHVVDVHHVRHTQRRAARGPAPPGPTTSTRYRSRGGGRGEGLPSPR